MIVPFGLCLASQVFTHLMEYVAVAFVDRGLDALFYLDDQLLTSPSWSKTEASVQVAKEMAKSIGFTFNLPKFPRVPQQRLDWVGMDWDTFALTSSFGFIGSCSGH